MSVQESLAEFEVLVVGAGVVGLAVAREMSLQGFQVCLLEAEGQFGSGTSSRNSEVIHAGIYYPKDSLKALMCVEGKRLLYAYCDEYQVPYKRCGKLIVAQNESQLRRLEQIYAQGRANGVDDLEWLDQKGVAQKEPDVSAIAGIFSPSTGIIDSHALMQQLLSDFERAGGTYVANSKVMLTEFGPDGLLFDIQGQDFQLKVQHAVNAAGLNAWEVLGACPSYDRTTLPQAHYAKGDYFSYSGRTPFKHLIYPVPEVGGLGVHLTLDIGGGAKFGPDVSWISESLSPSDFDYRVDEGKREQFAQAIEAYWPGLERDKLHPSYSGVRPKLSGPKDAPADFLIQTHAEHGVKGLINLFGIESPGLTSCLAIAKEVARQVSLQA